MPAMDNSTQPSFLNGQSTAFLSAFDRGLYYGHGLFETLRVCRGEIPLWSLHRARLLADAERLGLTVSSELLEQYRDQLLLAAAAPADGVMKIIITAGEGGRGYAAPDKLVTSYLLQWFPLPENNNYAASGIQLWVSEQRLADSPSLAGIKHLNRLEQVLARAEQAVESYPEGLMLDNNGNVIEAIASNLFCYREGVWFTPVLNRCGVAGVMREYLLANHVVEQCDIILAELTSMDEIFICNSVKGICPVIAIDGVGEWSVGSITQQWQQQLRDDLGWGELVCFG